MNLYVGNLAYTLTEDELREVFAEFGSVDSVIIIKDKFTGNSRGFGFVEMQADEEATAAMNELNGREVKGRSIVVNEARPRTENRRSGGREKQGGGNNWRY